MSWLTDPLGYDFVLRALAEVVVMGATCGAIGAYVIVRRLAFIGDAISHAVFPGIVLAYLAGLSIFGGALVAGLITALGIALVARGGRIREDTAIGIFFAAAFALGIVLISTRHTFQGDLTGFLIGNLQGVSAGDIAVSAAVGLAIILVLAMLVTPAATARLLVDRFVPMLALGSLLGAVVGVAGYYVSFHLGTASGGTIVLLATAVFVVAFVASPTHGLLGQRLHRHPQHAGASPAVDPPTGHEHGA